MAAALLGKCIGLLALVVLFYTCCYAFRIRDGGPQPVSLSVEQTQRATCTSIFGRCTDKTSATTSTTRKWHDTAVPRTASSRKPPVEVTSTDDDRNTGAGGIRSRHERSSTAKNSRTKSVELYDDDEDDAVVEVEESGEEEVSDVTEDSGADVSHDQENEDDGEDDDDDEDEDDEEKHFKVRRKASEEEDDDDDDEEKSVKAAGKGVGDLKSTAKKEARNKPTKTIKSTKYSKDGDADDEDETEEPKKKVERPGPLKKKDKVQEDISDSDVEDKDDDEDDEKDANGKDDDEDDEKDANGKDDDSEDKDDNEDDDEDDDEDEDDEDDEESEEVIPTPPPRKLEKVRHADKDKVRPVQIAPSAASSPKVDAAKVEKSKIEAPKQEDIAKKVEVTKKPVETAKKPTESTGKPGSSTKKVEPPKSTKVEAEKPKPAPKTEEKTKVPVKPEPSKVPPKAKDQTKQPEKAPVKPVNVKTTAGKSEVLRTDKKESKPKTKTGAEGPISLAELNDAILHVPTFVPNFTAIEDPECQQHGKIFLRQLRGYKLWALQMLDASAKIPSGLLRGNINQLGDFDQCLGVMAHVKVDDKTIKVQGKYCLASIDLHASNPDMKLPVNLMQARAFIRGSMRDPGHFIPKFTTVNWALCLPAACSSKDAEGVLENALSSYNSTAGIRFTVDVDPNMCYVKQKTRIYSKETIAVLYFYATIVCLVIVATVRDYFVVSEGKGNYSERIIMSFSLRRTVKVLLKEGSSEVDITCIHGIRALVTIVLYIAHQLIPVSRLPFANRILLTEVANYPISSVLRTSMLYTDAFLLLSGVLTAYNMAYEMKTRGEIRWFCRFIARYIRLTPALLVVVFWYAFVMEHIGSGPQWNSTIMENAELCKNNAWTNLLYIQNFFPFEEMCATHTHQLALDMQLSLLAPVLVFFLQCKSVIGILLICFFVLLSATLRYMATISNYLSLVIFHGMSLKHLYKTGNLTYILPLHRGTPYVFGVGLGVLLHYTGRNVRIHKVLVILGWLIAMALGSWSLFSPWRLARRDYVYDVEEATHYTVISPILWALALCWSIFACFTNNGGMINRFLSNYWLLIFSRISYAVYLTQFAVFFYNVGTTRYSREFQLHTAIDPAEAATVVAASIALTLLFDLPMQEIKSVIMESTDSLIAEVTAEEGPAAEDKDKAAKLDKEGEVREKVFEEGEEVASTGWDWQKDVLEGGAKPDSEGVEDKEEINVPVVKKSEGRRKSFVGYEPEAIPTWDWIKSPRKLSKNNDEYVEKGRRSRNSQRDYPNDSEDEALEFYRIQQEREDALRRSRRSLSRSRENKRFLNRENDEEYSRRREEVDDAREYRRSESRGRSAAREPEDYRSWEFVVKERSSSRGPDPKRISVAPEEHEPVVKQIRATLSRSIDGKRIFSSESEEEPLSQRQRPEKKHHPVEPRVSDEEDWESELRIRRKQFMEKIATQEPEEPLDVQEDLISLKRRSSAEGRIALLKDPSGDDNMDAWTVSIGPRIAQLGSSQEPSEPDDDSIYMRRREFRERAPPLRDDIPSEEEVAGDSSRRASYTSGSQVTSVEEDEDVKSYNFVLTKESKRVSLQDLSKLSQEESDLTESGWNVVKNDGSDSVPKATLGLYKRESIIKSQASEEDPEYLLPERPKLVQQEREHPFKKEWHMQKSRSEEDGSAAYAIREAKEQSEAKQAEAKSKDDDPSSIRRELSGEQSEDVGSFADDESESISLSQSRSTDTEEHRASSKSEDTESTSTGRSQSTSVEDTRGSSKFEGGEREAEDFPWPSEDEQFTVYKTTLRRKSEETDWSWEQEET